MQVYLRGWIVWPCRVANHSSCQHNCFPTWKICGPTEKAPRKKRFQHFLAEQPKLHLEKYFTGKRIKPKNLSFPVFGHADLLLSYQEQLQLSWIMCCQLLKDQYIPSWTDFTIKIYDRDITMESSVIYFPF